MPRYDLICPDCKTVERDVFEPMDFGGDRSCECGGQKKRMMPLTQPPQGGDTPRHSERVW